MFQDVIVSAFIVSFIVILLFLDIIFSGYLLFLDIYCFIYCYIIASGNYYFWIFNLSFIVSVSLSKTFVIIVSLIFSGAEEKVVSGAILLNGTSVKEIVHITFTLF